MSRKMKLIVFFDYVTLMFTVSREFISSLRDLLKRSTPVRPKEREFFFFTQLNKTKSLVNSAAPWTYKYLDGAFRRGG